MLRLSWLMLHLWWILFFLVFVLCCRLLCREENSGCFSLFSLTVTADILSIIDLWHRARKVILQCIFFTDIYLLVICTFFSFGLFYFYVSCFILEGKQDSIEKRRSLLLAFYFGDRKCHINVKSIKTNVKIEITAELKSDVLSFTVTVKLPDIHSCVFKLPTNSTMCLSSVLDWWSSFKTCFVANCWFQKSSRQTDEICFCFVFYLSILANENYFNSGLIGLLLTWTLLSTPALKHHVRFGS